MRWSRISIRSMLGIVAFIALACVALVRANDIWASSMFTAALAVVSFAVLAAIFRRGTKQAFWIGFALFGWLYLWMAHWPGDEGGGVATWRLQQDSTDTLPTTKLLVHAYMEWLPKVRTPQPVPNPASLPTTTNAGGTPMGGYGGYGGGGFGGSLGGPGAGGVVGPTGAFPAPPPTLMDYPALHEFTRIGHSLFTIILAFVGGLIAIQLYKSREQEQSAKREPLTSV